MAAHFKIEGGKPSPYVTSYSGQPSLAIPVGRCSEYWHSNLNESLNPFPFFGLLLNIKVARVEVNVSLAFLHCVRLHPSPFVSEIAVIC